MQHLALAGRALACAFIAFATMLGTTCGTLNALDGGSSELPASARDAVLSAADKNEPVLKEVTSVRAVGVVSASADGYQLNRPGNPGGCLVLVTQR